MIILCGTTNMASLRQHAVARAWRHGWGVLMIRAGRDDEVLWA